MTGLRTIVIKFVAFAVISALMGWIILNTMLNGLPGDSHAYKAMLSDVSGLRTGDDVRVAGVRVGRVQAIKLNAQGAEVDFDLAKVQPLLTTTKIVMRYQNLLGQRYLAMEQDAHRGAPMPPGSTVPLSRTSPGFDLTDLLNGFRPLFDVLKPEDINALATSMVKVLQGEGGTVESLLRQTATLTNTVASRDQVFDQVLTNLTPVLRSMAGQGTELRSTVKELRALMTGLARDRKSIGASIDGMSQLIGSTSRLLRQVRQPTVAAVKRFRATMDLFLANQKPFAVALKSFGTALGVLGRATSYTSAINLYICSFSMLVGTTEVNLNGTPGPWSQVCTG